MRWSFARAFFRTESFFGIVALVIAISNAPVFQNVGIGDDWIQRYLLVTFYVSLIVALLALFVGRLLFELNCPEVIKKYAGLDDYLNGVPDKTTEDVTCPPLAPSI